MKIEEGTIAGLFRIVPTPFADDRGSFFRYFCRDTFRSHGIADVDFVQFNHSFNHRRGTLRGMHYQMPPHAEAKFIRCVRGAVYDVFVDLRQGSPSFLRWDAQELSATNHVMVHLPPGIAHGFITLEDDSELLYHHSATYTPEAERGLRYDDPRLAIDWPLAPTVISERDLGHPPLADDFAGLAMP
ncbi:MAG: dTDP-4-dehydrorhamnose 3,5-epimerase [Acidobacteriota bacterium]